MASSRREKEKKMARRTDARAWAKKQEKGFEPTCVKIPEGFELYKIDKAGTFKVDFMPYVAGAGNKNADEGFQHFEREYDSHALPTADGRVRMYVCRQKSFGKKCAVCDWLKSHGGNADPDLVKQIRGKTRHLWLVNDKPGDENNKLKMLDTNHYNRGIGFGEQIADAITSVEDYGDFWTLDAGLTVSLTVKEQLMGGGKKYFAVTRIDFLPRKYEYPDNMIDDAPCLDDCLIDPGYDAVKKLLEQGSSDEEEEEEEKLPNSRTASGAGKNTKGDRKPVEKDDDDEDDQEEEESPKSQRRSGKGTSTIARSTSTDDDEEDDSKEEETSHKKNGKKLETAREKGIKVGSNVKHKKHGVCEVVHVSSDGTSLRMEDEEGQVHTGIGADEVSLVGKDNTDDDDNNNEKEETTAPKRRGRPPGSKNKAKAEKEEEPDDDDSEEDEDDMDEDDSDLEPEDDDEEEDEPVSKKRKK